MKQDDHIQQALLTPEAVAKLLGLNSTSTLATWRSKKRYGLSYIKVGSRIRYRIQDVEAFILASRIEGGS